MTLPAYRALLRAQIARALSDTAEAAAREARALAPVRTGALRGSISASPAAWQGDTAAAAVAAAVPYAVYVELGTCRQSPRPYLRPAARLAAEGLTVTI